MVTPSPPSQARSRARHEALLRAAIALVAEGGTRAVTHRAVAQRAGVPLAATTYYFESIQQLTEEALRLHVRERLKELADLAATVVDGPRSVDEIAARFAAALLARDRDSTIAQFEVFLEASRNPALREAVAETLAEFEDLARGILASLGARRPEQAASSFVALINGFALSGLARPRPLEVDGAELLDAMRALFISQVMDDSELAHWHERLTRSIDQSQTSAG